MELERVLLVDDDELSRTFLAEALRHLGLAVTAVGGGKAALRALREGVEPPDLVLTDLKMPSVDGMHVLAAAKSLHPELPVVLVTAHGTVGVAVEAMQNGADDVLEKPVSVERLELLLLRMGERRRLLEENRRLRAERQPVVEPVARSPVMRSLLAQVERIAQSDLPVLITGESGTGKEVIADLLHRGSPRADGPQVKVNCAAIAPELYASELFGHERGAFTGADRRRVGCFEQADGGTLFLDEITEIDVELQAKLLRVLQEGELCRVGGGRVIEVDVRVIAASNRDPRQAVAAGKLREDLFFRLEVVPCHVPALRERGEDIVPLAEQFLAAAGGGRLTGAARTALRSYAWPGNVRELKNLMQRAALLADSGIVDAALIEPWLGALRPRPSADAIEALVGLQLQEVERRLIERTLERFGGHRGRTADALGLSVRTLFNRLRQPAG